MAGYLFIQFLDGRIWSEPLEVMTGNDCTCSHFHRWVGSCRNCTILPAADNCALLSFSDFYVLDENGVKRKGIKTIEIVAE